MREIKECPFCGSQPVAACRIFDATGTRVRFFVECGNTECRGNSHYYELPDSEDKAISDWNKRTKSEVKR